VATITQYFSKLFTGSGPAKPDALGDIFYAQDLARDYAWVMDRIGSLVADVAGGTAILISGGVVTDDGSHAHVNITAGVGYAPFTVTLGIDGNVPPTSGTEDITAVRIAWGAQTSVGTFAGTTTYYVKMAYTEANGLNRQRARASGTYYFTKQPSFAMTIDTSAPTAYQVLLATITVSAGAIASITQAQPAGLKLANTERYVPTPGYTPSVGDVVELNYDGTIRKAKRVNSGIISSGSSVNSARAAYVDATRAVVVWMVGSNIIANVVTVDPSTLAFTWGSSPQTVFTVGGTPLQMMCDVINGNDSSHVYIAVGTHGTGASALCYLYYCTVSGSGAGATISVGSFQNVAQLQYLNQPTFHALPGAPNNCILADEFAGGSGSLLVLSNLTSGTPTQNTKIALTSGGLRLGVVNSDGTFFVNPYWNGVSPYDMRLQGCTISGTSLSAAFNVTAVAAGTPGWGVAAISEGPPNSFLMELTNSNTAPFSTGIFSPKRLGGGTVSTYLGAPVPTVHNDASIPPVIYPVSRAAGIHLLALPYTAGDGYEHRSIRFIKKSGNGGIVFGDEYDISENQTVAQLTASFGACLMPSGTVLVCVGGSAAASSSFLVAIRRRNTILGVAVDSAGTVQRSGSLPGLSGLTVGPVGVDDNGNLTSVVGEAKIGQALSATVLDLQVVPGI